MVEFYDRASEKEFWKYFNEDKFMATLLQNILNQGITNIRTVNKFTWNLLDFVDENDNTQSTQPNSQIVNNQDSSDAYTNYYYGFLTWIPFVITWLILC